MEEYVILIILRQNLFSFKDIELLRDEGNYAKRNYFSKKSLVESRLEWQNHPIPRTLVHMSTAYCNGDKSLSKSLKVEARDMFKSVLGFMKDTYHPYPMTLAAEVLHRCLEEPLLRDEIFCQLVKQ